MGILGPLFFLSGVVLWVYRATRKVPFPLRKTEQGELVLGLIEPEQVPSYWLQWKEEFAPLVAFWQEVRGILQRRLLKR